MQLLASEEYGLRCLLRVAEGQRDNPSQPLTIQAIAEAEGLSAEYTAKLLRQLRMGGLLTSTRGATGGYKLTRSAREISAWDAVRVLGGELFPEGFCACHPGRRSDCVRSRDCAVRSLWRSLGRTLQQELERVSLNDLCRGEAAMDERLRIAGPTEVSQPWPS